MSDYQPERKRPEARPLRDRAEARLNMTRTDVKAMSAEEVQRLVHELQIHQIELEIQNDELRKTQVDLADSRDRLAELYEFAPVGYFTLGKEGTILRCNLTAAEMLGLERGALLGRSLSEFVAHDAQDDLFLHLQAVFESDQKQGGEFTVRRPDGETRIFRAESRRARGDGRTTRSTGPASHTALIDLTERREAEESLCEARDQLERRVEERTRELRRMSQVFRDATDPIILHDTEGTILDVNAEMERLVGWSRDELIGRSLKLVVPEERHDQLEDLLARCRRGEAIRNVEGARLTRDGERIPVLLTKSPLSDGDGEDPCAIASIAKDLRELKRTEAELRESRALAEMHRDIAYMANRAQDIDEAVNFCLEKVSFYNGWTFGHAYFPAPDDPERLQSTASCYMPDAKRFEAFRQATLRLRPKRGEGLPGRVFATGKPQWTCDLSELTNRAELAEDLGIATVAAFPVLVREEVAGVLEFFSDQSIEVDPRLEESMAAIGAQLGRVLERHEAEQLLRASEARLRQLTEQLRDVVWMRDARTHELLYCNAAFETVFGRPRAELEAAPFGFFLGAVDRRDREQMSAAVEKMKAGHDLDETIRIVRPDETIRWLRYRGYPMRDEAGRIYRFAGTAEDITERRETERELRRLEREISKAAEDERRRIAQDLHDSVGSVLTAINLRLKILRDQVAGGEAGAEEAIESISSMAEQAIVQTRTLTHGLYPIGDDPDDLMVALRDLAAAIRTNGAIECRFVCPEPVRIENPRVANQLYRIAQEAANNAVKHSGGALLSIELKKRKDRILLVIKDDGKGFDPKAKFRHGCGLGLRIMQYRANEAGAALRVAPRRTRGVRVVCNLPCDRGEDEDSS